MQHMQCHTSGKRTHWLLPHSLPCFFFRREPQPSRRCTHGEITNLPRMLWRSAAASRSCMQLGAPPRSRSNMRYLQGAAAAAAAAIPANSSNWNTRCPGSNRHWRPPPAGPEACCSRQPGGAQCDSLGAVLRQNSTHKQWLHRNPENVQHLFVALTGPNSVVGRSEPGFATSGPSKAFWGGSTAFTGSWEDIDARISPPFGHFATIRNTGAKGHAEWHVVFDVVLRA
jgi:hypothetical protein